jgi:CRP/FNR family transcriptional regulator, cyclic AMP receptor protein
MQMSGDSNADLIPGYFRPAEVSDLEGRELFEDADPVALGEIAKDSFVCRLGAQEEIKLIRREVAHVNVILSGYVAIWINSQFTSAEETFLAWRGPEQIIGEMKAVANTPTEARIVTCEPCEFIEMRNDTFTDVAHDSARIYRNIARLLVKKMEHERCRSEIIRMTPAWRKVAQILLHLAHERCGGDRSSIPNRIKIPGVIHQDQVAGYAGTKRETVNRALSLLRRREVIDYDRNVRGSEITILNRQALERSARNGDDPTA